MFGQSLGFPGRATLFSLQIGMYRLNPQNHIVHYEKVEHDTDTEFAPNRLRRNERAEVDAPKWLRHGDRSQPYYSAMGGRG